MNAFSTHFSFVPVQSGSTEKKISLEKLLFRFSRLRYDREQSFSNVSDVHFLISLTQGFQIIQGFFFLVALNYIFGSFSRIFHPFIVKLEKVMVSLICILAKKQNLLWVF